jgi:hypothetical protein
MVFSSIYVSIEEVIQKMIEASQRMSGQQIIVQQLQTIIQTRNQDTSSKCT